ncbi:MAG: hypothetical protein ACRDWH_03360 [Acidimicrobiia bacterium]
MKRRTFVLVAFVLLVLAMLPAQAAHLGEPTRVAGSTTCASLGVGGSSLKIEPVANGTFDGPGAVQIILSDVSRTTLTFEIVNGAVHDVIVKGSAANRYHYSTPVQTDSNLTIPNGNKLNWVEFCYEFEGVQLSCGQSIRDQNQSGNTTGEFERFQDPTTPTDECGGDKFAVLEVSDDRIVTFIPRGLGDSTYRATLTFPVVSSSIPPLQYDQTDDGVDSFENVPACEDPQFDLESGEVVHATLPEGHTWCHVGFQVVEGVVTWEIFGVGDPRYR